MRTLFLHIGMHKTGTTSIQGSLQNFDNGKLRYARLLAKNPNHSVPIYTIFGAHPETHNVYVARGVSAADMPRIRDVHRNNLLRELKLEREDLVFSGEDMSILSREDVAGMKEFFAPYFDRIQIIAYVREPIGFASSMLQQVIKGRLKEVVVPRPNYQQRFEKYILLFGRENVEFSLFSQNLLASGGLVSDFCAKVGIDPGAVEEVRSNGSLSTEAVALLLEWNKARNPRVDAAAKQSVIDALSSIFPGKFNLGDTIWMDRSHVKDVEWMERVSGLTVMPPPQRITDNKSIDLDLSGAAKAASAILVERLGELRIPVHGDTPADAVQSLYDSFS